MRHHPIASSVHGDEVNKTVPSQERLREQFGTEGYVILRGFLAQDAVEQACSELQHLVEQRARMLLDSGRISDLMADEPFETRFFHLYKAHLNEAPRAFRRELHGAGLFSVFFNPSVLDVTEMLLGDEIRLYPNYTVRPKLPDHAATLVLWHQDGGYTEAGVDSNGSAGELTVDQLRMVNVWSPLVPARRGNGCMQFVPGSHKLGAVPHEKKEHYLEISRDYLEPHEAQAIDIELDPGDVVLFHNLLFHRGLPNTSQTIRWSMDWRYQDATQPTLRKEEGHLARSRKYPERVVQDGSDWASRTFS